MSRALIMKLRQQRDADRASAETLLAKEEAGTELTDAEKANLESLTNSATALDARIKSLSDTEMARIEAQNLDLKLDGAIREQRSTAPEAEKPATSLGEQFVKSTAFTNYLLTPSGNSGIVTSEFALVSTGNLVKVSRASEPGMPTRRTPLLDSLGYEPVSGNAIDWIEWPVSAPVPATATAEGAPKPEATYAPQLRTGTLDKIAHHIPVTREMLEDVPRTQSIVSGALLDGVRQKAESAAALALVAANLPTATHDTLLKALRVGVANVSEAGFQANTVVLNPLDYAEIDIDLLELTMNGARRESPVWGLNVVPAGAVAAGTAYVGDFRVGMTLFDRQVTNVYITDSHAEEFISNILRILAEARMKAIVVRPEAIIECSATALP